MIDLEKLRLYCISKDGTSESFPFDHDTLVIKVDNKIFAIIGLTPPFSINLKCDPELAIQLREEYEFALPGYHMNKKHWNTIKLEVAPQKLVEEWIDHSYGLITAQTRKPKKKRD